VAEEDLLIVDEVFEDIHFEEMNDNENASEDDEYCSSNSDQSVNSEEIIHDNKDALDDGYNIN